MAAKARNLEYSLSPRLRLSHLIGNFINQQS